MRLVGVPFFFLAILTAWCTASAQEMPQPPAVVTNYEQCDAWQQAFKDHISQLATERLLCLRKLTVEDTRDQVPLNCGWGKTARRCAAVIDSESCAYRRAASLLADCRTRVRKFLEGKDSASGGFQGDWWEQDLRNDIIGAYRDGLPSAIDAVDFAGKSFLGKVGVFKKVLDARTDPTPKSTLAAGQAFASEIFSGSGASDLAVALFDAASGGAAAAGASAIDQMNASLLALEAERAGSSTTRKAEGISFPSLHAQTKPTTANRQESPVRTEARTCDGRPSGYVYCTGISSVGGFGTVTYDGVQCMCRQGLPCEWEPRSNLTVNAC